MRLGRWSLLGLAMAAVGCAARATGGNANILTPLGAHLGPGAKTGPVVPLRVDPTARVIRSTAANLPAASFLPSQAKRGQAIYEESCSTCHQTSQHIGQAFVENWNDRRVYDFYALVRATMPLDNPGGLKEQQYLDVVAYLLQANHQAAPVLDSLRADTVALRGHKIAVHFP
jgi:mono/diheme cytochrome c family protein